MLGLVFIGLTSGSPRPNITPKKRQGFDQFGGTKFHWLRCYDFQGDGKPQPAE
jgi:hypothetical protein